eukprot:g473.t1
MTPEALEAIRRASQSPVGPSGGLHSSPTDGSRPPSLSLAQVESDRIAADKAKARLDAQAEEAEKAEAEKIARQEAQAAAAKARAEALEKERAAEQLRKEHYNSLMARRNVIAATDSDESDGDDDDFEPEEGYA